MNTQRGCKIPFLVILLISVVGLGSTVLGYKRLTGTPSTFQGKLFRSDTNGPVAGAKLALMPVKASNGHEPALETSTGADGTFAFEQVPEGKYTLSMSAVYDTEDAVPCKLLMGKIKGEKDSVIVVMSKNGKYNYQVFIKGLVFKSGKALTKEYDLACVSAFGN
jgi:hypothetical protein